MGQRRSSLDNRSLQGLGALVAHKQIRLPEVNLPDAPSRPMTRAEECRLFQTAMADVVPLADRTVATPARQGRGTDPGTPDDPDGEAVQCLRQLVQTGEGFVLKHTAEYVQGAAEWTPPEMFRRIHGGHFAVQDHIDLHGLNLVAAQGRFDRFMRDAVRRGLRTVLVVHGRGRCSPGPPVLKRHLYRWLISGAWKRWVIAFTSARACDGGTGATVVLLRRTPRTGKPRNRRRPAPKRS